MVCVLATETVCKLFISEFPLVQLHIFPLLLRRLMLKITMHFSAYLLTLLYIFTTKSQFCMLCILKGEISYKSQERMILLTLF